MRMKTSMQFKGVYQNLNFSNSAMALSDLLQIRRNQSSPCYVIAEEQASDMDNVNVGTKERVLTERNMNNVRQSEVRVTNCDGYEHVPKVLNDTVHNVNQDQNCQLQINNALNDQTPLSASPTGTWSSRRLALCRRKLSLSTPATTVTETSAEGSAPLSTPSTPISSFLTSQLGAESSSLKDLQLQQQSDKNHSEIKSGHLVLIASNQNFASPTTKSAVGVNARTLSPARYPVLVKIHKKSYERYAIISRTRRQQTLPSFYLKLKHSRVTRLPSNPCAFSVVVDGAEGKSFLFEATSPESATEWTLAFSSDNSSSFRKASSQYHRQPSKLKESAWSQVNNDLYSSKSPRSPLMPVLSESLDEAEEREE